MRTVIRQLLPALFVPLCLVASVLATAPWLRAFPTSVAGPPFYGAALLSVVMPLIVVRVRPAWLWLSVLADLIVFALYTLVVALQDPTDLAGLGHGLYRGPSEVLTFALPLVSPRTLMVAPLALMWVAGALAGECLARRWFTLLPYLGFLVAFGLAYAATQRATGSDPSSAQLRETLLGAGLLVTLLLMRVAQAWLWQDESAESTQPDGTLPLRGLVIGTATTLVVAVGAAFAVQSPAFPKRADGPQRVPSVHDTNPVTPLAFTAALRPRTAKEKAPDLFSVRLDASSPGYFALANVDFYDGSGWSFTRTFRPSGGVLPADTDPQLRAGHAVTQQYRISSTELTSAPWMPFLYRAQRVTGTSVNIDPASGMIVPAGRVARGSSYTVRSMIANQTFPQVKATNATADTATPTTDTELPATVRPTLDRLVSSFALETGIPSSPPLPFLQALQKDLQTKYALSSAAQGSASGSSGLSGSPSGSSSPSGSPGSSHRPRSVTRRPLATRPSKHPSTSGTQPPTSSPPVRLASPNPSATDSGEDRAGATGFADVLASIVGKGRSGTPEQFATLVALVARDLGVPARVVTGFRVEPSAGTKTLAPGTYEVTGANAWTWAEIPIAGVGWVVLDAAPGRFTPSSKPTESAAAPTPSSSAPPSQNALISQGKKGNAISGRSRVAHAATTSTSAVLVALIIGVGLLLLALVIVLLSRKRVRAARRRRSPDPRVRLIGAWRESLDLFVEAGLPELTTLTSAEIAELAAAQFGAPTGAETASLGTAANTVTYSTTAVVAADDADRAWARHRVLRQQVRGQLGIRGRMAASLRYHRSGKTPGPLSPATWADAEGSVVERPRRTGRPGSGAHQYRGRRRAH